MQRLSDSLNASHYYPEVLSLLNPEVSSEVRGHRLTQQLEQHHKASREVFRVEHTADHALRLLGNFILLLFF
jgi:DUF971 family protein